jgi:protein O-mannosyl-transferase
MHAGLVNLLAIAGIFLAVLCVYSPALSGPFAFDDMTLLDSLRGGGFSSIPWTRPETRPLVTFSLAVEQLLFGSSPAVHRFGNLLIHSLAAWMLFDLARILRLKSVAAVSKTDLVSPTTFGLLVAGLWAMHPLQTESVAYIVQRGESLMGLFYFAFLNAIARYHNSGKLAWGIVAILCFVAGLWSKTVMVTALAVAPLMDRAFFYSTWREVWKKTGWIYLPPVALGFFAALLLLPGVMRGDANVGFGGYAPPVDLYLASQAEMVWRYLALSVWPYQLCIDYGLHPPASWTSQLGWILLTVGLIGTGIYLYVVGKPVVGFCILAPLAVLSITSSVVPTADLLVEHRMYVSLAAVAAAVVSLSERVLGQLRKQDAASWLGLVLILAMVVLGTRTYVRAADYASGEALWSGAVAVSPDNDRAIQNLMHAVGPAREAEVIIPQLVEAIKNCERTGLNARVPLQRLGELLVRAHAPEQAEPILRRAIDLDEQSKGQGYRDLHRDRDRAAAHVNLALVLSAKDDLEAAYSSMLSAIEHFDSDANTRAMAGDFAKRLGQTAAAREHFQRALELRPQWPQVLDDLAKLEPVQE